MTCGAEYHVSFRIRNTPTLYFSQIVSGLKREELRRSSLRWRKIAARVENALARRELVVAVFINGRWVHRREIRSVTYYGSARVALGRPPSKQGKKDIGSGTVIGFKLGDVVMK